MPFTYIFADLWIYLFKKLEPHLFRKIELKLFRIELLENTTSQNPSSDQYFYVIV